MTTVTDLNGLVFSANETVEGTQNTAPTLDANGNYVFSAEENFSEQSGFQDVTLTLQNADAATNSIEVLFTGPQITPFTVPATFLGNTGDSLLFERYFEGGGDPLLLSNQPFQPPAGTVITVPQAGTVEYSSSTACYCPGTLILTDRGEVAVEALVAGDRVITASGSTEAIHWIGRRSYGGRFLAGKHHLLPIRLRAGALGDGLPRRDLLVSPKHAMFVDGVLVPAGLLVNGDTIVEEYGCQRVDYIHVELDRHSIILAEGAPSESFVDDNSRGMFHNVAEWEALHPGQVSVPAVYCAPRVESGPGLEAIRRRLAGHGALALSA